MPGVVLTETWTHTGAAQFVGARTPWAASNTDSVSNGFGAFVWDNAPGANFVYALYTGAGTFDYTVDATSTDHYFSFTPKSEGPAYHAIVRFADSDNFIGVQLNFGRIYYRLRANGIDGPIIQWAQVPFDSTAVYEVRAEGTTLKLFKNGSQIGATIVVPTAITAARRVGFGIFAASMNPFLGPVTVGFLGAAQSGTLAVANAPVLQQMSAGTTTRSIAVQATWTGTPSAIRRRLENTNGTPVAGFDWATAIATPTGGSATITLANVPAGGPYFLKLDFANDSAVTARQANGFYVGLIVLVLGQSNMVGLGQATATPAAAAGSYVWNSSVATFSTPVGDGHGALLATIRQALNIPVGIINVAVGQTAIAAWQPGQPNYQNAIAQITAAGNDCGAIIWGQGESDAANTLVNPAVYQAGLTAIYDGLRAALNRTAAQLPWVMAVIGRNARELGTSYGDNASWQSVRTAQLAWAAVTAGAKIGAFGIDMPMTDSTHYTNAGYAEIGKRLGRSIARVLTPASVGYDGAGPKIISASRSGAAITVQCDLQGHASLTGTPPFTGWEISRDNFASTLPISSSALQPPDQIVLTLATLPGANDALALRYLYGANPDVSQLVGGGAA